MPSQPFYDYLEERPFGSLSGQRRNRVNAVDDPLGVPHNIPYWEHSLYQSYLSYSIEKRESVPESEGVWGTTYCRVARHTGDPGKAKWPYDGRPYPLPVDPNTLSPRVRVHHYFRILSAEDGRRTLDSGVGFNLGLGVTEEWHDPPDGIIQSIPPTSPVVASHSVGIVEIDRQHNMFVFPNSWGDEWGHDGWGKIAADLLDRYLVESWAAVGLGYFPPIAAQSGLVVLLWKSSFGGQEVHGREIVDAATGERIAWCFLVRRGDILDIEEFFVWPEYRRMGYGTALAGLARELALKATCSLRCLVSFVDCETANRAALLGVFRHLGLHLHPSAIKSVGLVGLDKPFDGVVPEPHIPQRPASIHDDLNPEKGTREYVVWFGTDRRPVDPSNLSEGFSGERGDRVHFGTCRVAIPKSHRFGSVGASWWKRWLRLSSDEPLKITSRTCQPVGAFWASLAAEFAKYPDQRQALIFLHGYRNTFDHAAIRTAQIGFDLKLPGVAAFFSWASAGSTAGYTTDEASIEASEPTIAAFLTDFIAQSGADRIHLIAHSMGNRGLLRAMQRIVGRLPDDAGIRFGQVILAAPDVDAAVFGDLAQNIVNRCVRATLYVSPHDRAVMASGWIHTYPRAGLTPPVTIVPGIDTIEIPRLDLMDPTWHSYFAEAEGLLHDMFTLIQTNRGPSDRQRLDAARTLTGECYWTMRQ